MTINLLIFWVLFMEGAAESANSNSSVQATTTTTTTSEDPILDWVKITAVPLGVFLIGACIWGIIVDTTASWRSSFNVNENGLPEAEEVHAHRHIINGSSARDLEEGLELSQHSMDDDLAMAPNPLAGRDGTMQPQLESPNDK